MRSVTYSMGVSLDGYIVGPDGDITAPPPDEEVWRFVTDEIRGVGVHLMGRKLYETMLYWETADQDPSLDDAEIEWAARRKQSQVQRGPCLRRRVDLELVATRTSFSRVEARHDGPIVRSYLGLPTALSYQR